MSVGGIYSKTCPACAAVHGCEADRCACGHAFVSEDAQTAVDDELYEAYLGARIAQALEALELARASLRAVPGDYARALRVMQQVHELQALRRELEPAQGGADADRETSDRGFPTPTEAFRAAQAARAEAIARRNGERARPQVAMPVEDEDTRSRADAARNPAPIDAEPPGPTTASTEPG